MTSSGKTGVYWGRSHHHLASGVRVSGAHRHAAVHVDHNGHLIVGVHLLVVTQGLCEVVVAATLIDRHTMANNPDVDTNVHEGNEQKYELDDKDFPGFSGVVCLACVHEGAHGWEENVEKQAHKTGTARDRLDMLIAAAHI